MAKGQDHPFVGSHGGLDNNGLLIEASLSITLLGDLDFDSPLGPFGRILSIFITSSALNTPAAVAFS
jgi:hypothetical protein